MAEGARKGLQRRCAYRNHETLQRLTLCLSPAPLLKMSWPRKCSTYVSLRTHTFAHAQDVPHPGDGRPVPSLKRLKFAVVGRGRLYSSVVMRDCAKQAPKSHFLQTMYHDFSALIAVALTQVWCRSEVERARDRAKCVTPESPPQILGQRINESNPFDSEII